MDLEWEKPKSDGGSPIQEYIIQKKEKGTLYWVNAATIPGNKTKVRHIDFINSGNQAGICHVRECVDVELPIT